MNGIHLALVGLNLSIVAGFWMVRNTLTTGAVVTEIHHLLLWGGLLITLGSLAVPAESESAE